MLKKSNQAGFMAAIAALLTAISASAADNTRYVNMFMGTAGDHGQVTPAAQVPFGLASVCPDSTVPRHGGYDYEVPSISGISVMRISGVGGDGAGGNISIRPAYPQTGLSIIKDKEFAVPGFYRAELDNDVTVSLTATSNVAFERYEFAKDAPKVLSVNFDSAIDHRRNSCAFVVAGPQDIDGWVSSSTVCNFGKYRVWYRLHTDVPFVIEKSDAKTAVLKFADDVTVVEVRLALSPFDAADAAEQLSACEGLDFGSVRRLAHRAWRELLSRVDVYGSTREQKALFYTSMYRVFLSPFRAGSLDGRFIGTDGQVHQAGDWTYYSGWSMWDTFRTKFPMITLLAPEEMTDICRSLVSLYTTGKMNWATMNECVPTVRTEHSQVTLLDAWNKGIRGFDMSQAFVAMEAEREAGLVKGSRQGLTRNAPDQKMETIYDIWAMSGIADIIGNREAAGKYAKEASELFQTVWTKEFMTITDRFSLMKGNGMYQGTRWQYRWALPQYASEMKALAGSEKLASQLSEFFSRHLFNQGNEPDIQTPFMFNLFGHPERTDSLVNALLTDDAMVHLYGGNAEYPKPFVGRAFQDRLDGYAPEMDEDDGTMSAWYMFCQMGLYPLCVGTEDYELFTPLFSRIVLSLPSGTTNIVNRCQGKAASSITIDGQVLDGRTISHSRLLQARRVVFE